MTPIVPINRTGRFLAGPHQGLYVRVEPSGGGYSIVGSDYPDMIGGEHGFDAWTEDATALATYFNDQPADWSIPETDYEVRREEWDPWERTARSGALVDREAMRYLALAAPRETLGEALERDRLTDPRPLAHVHVWYFIGTGELSVSTPVAEACAFFRERRKTRICARASRNIPPR